MKKIFASLLLISVLSSFYQANTLKGKWEYAGDIFNGKKEVAPTEYTLQRKYNNQHYEAFILEKGSKTEKYETGDYTLNADTCLETQTWTNQETKLLNVTVHYHYEIRNDTLILSGTLPNGRSVEEFWKRVK